MKWLIAGISRHRENAGVVLACVTVAAYLVLNVQVDLYDPLGTTIPFFRRDLKLKKYVKGEPAPIYFKQVSQ